MTKTPFRHQISEYDCVPTTFLNALAYLLDRSDIPPTVVQRVYLYGLDVTTRKSLARGTSGPAIRLLCDWLDNFKEAKFHVETEVLEGDKVHLGPRSRVTKQLKEGGVALLRVSHSHGHHHYILALAVENGWVHAFDPYPVRNKRGCYEFLAPTTKQGHNLKIRMDWLDTQSNKLCFRLGTSTERECVLLRRV